jgi:microcin C transport system permease protein
MGAYILRRLLLIIPTLFGIMVINFTLTQFVPGGPIEQIIARIDGEGDVFGAISGGPSDFGASSGGEAASQGSSDYAGARGLPPEFIEELEREFGFDKPPLERFFTMIWNYMRLDFGESYFRSIGVFELVAEKLPVSISLGLWSTVIAYLVSIPLGIRKAVRDGSTFDTWTSGLIIVAYAIPGFLFAILLLVLFAGGTYWQIFPLRGLTSDNWEQLSLIGKILDYFWHIALRSSPRPSPASQP